MKCLFCGSPNIKRVKHLGEKSRSKCADCAKEFYREDVRGYATVELSFDKYSCAFKCDLSKIAQKRRKAIYEGLNAEGYLLPGGGAVRNEVLPKGLALSPKVAYICVGHNRLKSDEKDKWLFATNQKAIFETYQAWRVTADELIAMISACNPS